MPSERPAIRLQDILDNVRLIQSYVLGMDRAAVEADQLAPGLPWKAVRALGNVPRHAYDQVDPARIWKIVTQDLLRWRWPSMRH